MRSTLAGAAPPRPVLSDATTVLAELHRQTECFFPDTAFLYNAYFIGAHTDKVLNSIFHKNMT